MGDHNLDEYRNFLSNAEQAASASYDKAVMTLAGGAFGLSFVFLKDFLGAAKPHGMWLLIMAWVLLALSIVCILVSILTGRWSLRKAISQLDQKRIHSEKPGAWFSLVTETLNVLAAVFFVGGVAFLAWFAITNVG